MPFVSATRLRIRSWRFLPAFFLSTLDIRAELRRAEGFLGGSLLADRRRAFWTLTVWQNAEAMQRYILAGAHKRAMPKLAHWCDEACIVHWEQTSAEQPDWSEVHSRMLAEGRASRLSHASISHLTMEFAAPRMRSSVRIPPR